MKNHSDNNAKRRLNLADIIIITFAVFLILLLAKLFLGDSGISFSNNTEVEYTIKIENVGENVLNLIKTENSVIDNSTGTNIGTINALEVANSVFYEYDRDLGYYKSYAYPDLYDISIKVMVMCDADENRYNIGDFEIVSGKQFELIINNTQCDGIITKVDETQKNASRVTDGSSEEQQGD